MALISRLGATLTLIITLLLVGTGARADGPPVLKRFLSKVPAAELVPGATAYGEMRSDVPVVPVMKGSDIMGYAYITSDFVGTTGYSGKPIHMMVAIDPDGKLLRADLVEHHEPIVLVGIPESKIRKMTDGYVGLDIVALANDKGVDNDVDIISGATVTIMIINDTVVRASIKVARALGLGGLENTAADTGPKHVLNMDEKTVYDWDTLMGDGSIRRLTLDIGQINEAFAATGDPRVLKNAEKGAPEDTYIDLNLALISAPGIGLSLLGKNEYKNLTEWLDDGDNAIMLAGRGLYSFKGSGYVRGGIFDRIQLVQGDVSVRFRDHDHKRLLDIAAKGAPNFKEKDIFKIAADTGFDPTKPFRVQLLVQRRIGALEKSFLTYDLGYNLPPRYITTLAQPQAAPVVQQTQTDNDARSILWKRIWQSKKIEIALLIGMLTVLTGVFFFQMQVTRYARAFYWFRMGFLTLTLVFLGFSQNAQLSVVNLMALGASLRTGFSWDAFLMDPLVFILWVSVAVTLLFWGRGGFCGWLCPFGAMQELSNQIARFFKVPQWKLPWGLHERLWPIKYMIFLVLFGVSLVSMSLAEHYAEVEPFKTAIILKFARGWPFVLFATVLLGIGLFIERFYCRYLCPLGAALAIPGRIRMFDWLKRYKECGTPCQTCANECFVQSIHPTGEINPNECLSCLHCQVLYQDHSKCPVVVKKDKRRAKMAQSSSAAALDRLTNHPNAKNK